MVIVAFASCYFDLETVFFHIRNIAKLPASGGQELYLLNSITDFCMQQSTCRQQFICKYFEESVGEPCNICDICQKDTMIQEKDMTEHAKDIVECFISLNRHKSKVKLSELAMTFMGSKAKDIIGQNFHSVPQHGKGKGIFFKH